MKYYYFIGQNRPESADVRHQWSLHKFLCIPKVFGMFVPLQ
ncbi:MAG TPA: hypothetical protein VJC37_07185 [Planctomycetota bacterium]|nr:hypothetical protein [Planctomycetota bacterium]